MATSVVCRPFMAPPFAHGSPLLIWLTFDFHNLWNFIKEREIRDASRRSCHKRCTCSMRKMLIKFVPFPASYFFLHHLSLSIFLFFHPLFIIAIFITAAIFHSKLNSFAVPPIYTHTKIYIHAQVSASICVRVLLYFIYVLILINFMNLPAAICVLLSSSSGRKKFFIKDVKYHWIKRENIQN